MKRNLKVLWKLLHWSLAVRPLAWGVTFITADSLPAATAIDWCRSCFGRSFVLRPAVNLEQKCVLLEKWQLDQWSWWRGVQAAVTWTVRVSMCQINQRAAGPTVPLLTVFINHFKPTREICSYTIILFVSLLVFLLGWCLLFDCGMTCSVQWLCANRDINKTFLQECSVSWAAPPLQTHHTDVYIWLFPLYNLLLKPDRLLLARPPELVSYLVPHNSTFLILKLQIWIFKMNVFASAGETRALFKIRKRLVEKTAPLSFLRNTVATFYIRHTFTLSFHNFQWDSCTNTRS